MIAEPFTTYPFIDALRCLMVAAALLLMALALRLVWVRRHESAERRGMHVHPATVLSYCGFLGMYVARRLDALGEPPDWWLVAAVLFLTLGWYGVLMRTTLSLTPPWRR